MIEIISKYQKMSIVPEEIIDEGLFERRNAGFVRRMTGPKNGAAPSGMGIFAETENGKMKIFERILKE